MLPIPIFSDNNQAASPHPQPAQSHVVMMTVIPVSGGGIDVLMIPLTIPVQGGVIFNNNESGDKVLQGKP